MTTAYKQAAVNQDAHDDAVRLQLGWCPVCRNFTTGYVPPTASDYFCHVCGEDNVVGATTAVKRGYITSWEK